MMYLPNADPLCEKLGGRRKEIALYFHLIPFITAPMESIVALNLHTD